MIKFFAVVFAVLTISRVAIADDKTEGMSCKKTTSFETVDGKQVIRVHKVCESK